MSASHVAAEEPYTVKEAARALGVSEPLLRDLIRSGQLPAYRYGPRKTLIYGEDLRAFKESRRVETPSTREVS
jgi:excisionase family DNA binding protein